MSSFYSLIKSCQADWDHYIQHEFIQRLGKGTLDITCFQHYLKQDYLFLFNFSRAWGLAVYKSHDLAEMKQSLNSLKTIVEVELDFHIEYCKRWRITENELNTLTEARANMAYTQYVLDVGLKGDILDLHIVLAPCLIGYGMIANWLKKQHWYNAKNNPYSSWIKMYVTKEFQQAMQNEIAWIDQRLLNIDTNRLEQLKTLFKHATQLEADFWQMGLDKSF
ncbi:thiaminase II [Gilliamella sp. B2776]|uniref:thiaminase II n=1 Tax=unclassified Gilliamella TaxID=2685620 RepID=UPI002269954F|nr:MULTISPECIES: thiaminase II [unclassified Gilliamella]MCX8650497.1 thiaminase II [Gilliamella sp. B2779]MCX8654457.1 thiaminase II [Gilliamella sp. B2737]MCX8656802.1 thiaminase II [Gilliamella sp. B2894]MCX8692345.1 thiaminase II [Gilliamella sp. B2776]MCX8694192.1 thiaminase II [Gilliamella sp. B2881]